MIPYSLTYFYEATKTIMLWVLCQIDNVKNNLIWCLHLQLCEVVSGKCINLFKLYSDLTDYDVIL